MEKQGLAVGTTQLPLARVKRIIKEDKDVNMINADSTFLIAAATELFTRQLAVAAYQKALSQKRKAVAYKDLVSLVKEDRNYAFLADVVPESVRLKEALRMQARDLQRDEDDIDED